MCCVCEPWKIPTNALWSASKDNLAAIHWSPEVLGGVCSLAMAAQNFVAIRFRDLFIVSLYISPNAGSDRFLLLLDDLRDFLTSVSGEVIICGDFNARSRFWGDSVTNGRGDCLETWAAELDLRLGNVGCVPTCVRPQGVSIVDLTWYRLHTGHFLNCWKVLDTETLSDHRYVFFSYEEERGLIESDAMARRYPRWNIKNWEQELFAEVLCVKSDCFMEEWSTEESARWLQSSMTDACDMASRRYGPRPARRAAHWWSDEVAVARNACITARRRATRLARNSPSAMHDEAREAYRVARRHLRSIIRRAKAISWQDLIDKVNRDPWGLPYKVVLNRLRRPSPKLSEMLNQASMSQLLVSLFPRGETHDPAVIWRDWQGPLENFVVEPEELRGIMRSSGYGRDPAPGPDGLTKRMWRRIPWNFLERLALIFNKCLYTGIYPSIWKRAILVLIPKEVWNSVGIPKARPICLLDEIGKLFERVLVSRIKSFMENVGSARLSHRQYGFRERRSTVDAVRFVRDFVRFHNGKRRFVIAVSVDIKNAFNSLPWGVIRWALERKGYPVYLRRIVDGYLSDRSVEYLACDGRVHVFPMTAGVPQGSALGTILWNIAFDYAIEMKAQPGCEIVAYADDTLVLAYGSTIEQVRSRMNGQLVPILRRLEALGLTVAAEKTNAVLFCGPGCPRPPDKSVLVRVNRVYIRTAPSFKYLGVILDSRLSFGEHFVYVADKVSKVSRALGRLMPNLRGPDEGKRRLYAGVLGSVALYAAPIWCDALVASRTNRDNFRRIQRTVALRVCSAYRTVSFDAATLLSRIIPWEFLAAERLRVYTRVSEARETGLEHDPREISAEERVLTLRQWEVYLSGRDLAGARTRGAILPHFGLWMARSEGSINFHVTQLMTGHGCFGSYLSRIQKRNTPVCWHCASDAEDSAEHTIFECAAWDVARQTLVQRIGPVDSMVGLIGAILRSKENWVAFSDFACEIMRRKEEVERVVERGGALPPVANMGAD